jgi:hypothetical protein
VLVAGLEVLVVPAGSVVVLDASLVEVIVVAVVVVPTAPPRQAIKTIARRRARAAIRRARIQPDYGDGQPRKKAVSWRAMSLSAT